MTAVSAVIPVYNGELYVGEAISSVLGQTEPPLECLVIDDGSTDNTAEAVRGFGSDVKYVRVEHGGVSNARNHGIRLARGELMAFLDHDDVWVPAKLERQIHALHIQPEAKAAVCAMQVVDVSGATVRLQSFNTTVPESVITGMVTFDGTDIPSINSCAVVRRDWLLENGGYDTSLSTCADWDLLMRLLLDGGIAYVDEPLARYRKHDSNMSNNIASIERDMVYAFTKAFADPRMPADVRAERRHAYGRMYRMLAGSYRDVGDRKAMLRTAAVALSHDPNLALQELKWPWRRRNSA
jgi:glycosyltransferase involved in cell wall biosynthesis